MANTLNLFLTEELMSFIDDNSGDGTLYVTPSEYVRDLLRHHKVRQDGLKFRESFIEGCQDGVAGRVYKYEGSIASLARMVK